MSRMKTTTAQRRYLAMLAAELGVRAPQSRLARETSETIRRLEKRVRRGGRP